MSTDELTELRCSLETRLAQAIGVLRTTTGELAEYSRQLTIQHQTLRSQSGPAYVYELLQLISGACTFCSTRSDPAAQLAAKALDVSMYPIFRENLA